MRLRRTLPPENTLFLKNRTSQLDYSSKRALTIQYCLCAALYSALRCLSEARQISFVSWSVKAIPVENVPELGRILVILRSSRLWATPEPDTDLCPSRAIFSSHTLAHMLRSRVQPLSFGFSLISFASFVSLSFPLSLWFPFYLFRLYATYHISTLIALRQLYKPQYFTYKRQAINTPHLSSLFSPI